MASRTQLSAGDLGGVVDATARRAIGPGVGRDAVRLRGCRAEVLRAKAWT